MMPTLDADHPSPEAAADATQTLEGSESSFDERFRKATLRASMFGGSEPDVRIGRYRVLRRLGAGTMGSVYLAVDESLERNVAVKVLRREDEVHRARMQREAKALAKLSHPNVVTVHEVGEQDGEIFVAMEYVPGQTLTEWLADSRSLTEILWMFGQAAYGLSAAHQAGVVHRDFKPDNVVVGQDGRVRVLDFGLAHTPDNPLVEELPDPARSTALDKPTLTRTGLLAGTPAYMSPEQFLGTHVDARADQFSFCVALREAVWGERPFAGDTVAELARAVIHGKPTLDGTTAPGTAAQVQIVRAVVERGLSRRPEARFESMGALVEALRGSAPPARSGVWLALAAGLVMMLLFAAGVATFAGLNAQPSSPADPAADVAETPTPAAAAPLEAAAPSGESPAAWDPSVVSCVSGTCTVPRRALAAMRGAGGLARQGRLVPSMRDGKTVGFKVFGVRADSLPGALGLHSGDLLTAIGGVPLDGGLEWTATLQRLLQGTEDQSITIAYSRKGAPMELTVVVTGPR